MMTKKQTENNEEINEEIEEKSAPLPGYSINKPVYLVQVNGDYFSGGAPSVFVSLKLTHEVATLKVQGWKVSKDETIDNLEDAEKKANRDEYLDIQFPWHRVTSIKNITFKR